MSFEPSSHVDSESEAHRLVGRFLQSFALLEQALNAGIGKLLSLEGGINDIVCSSIPFAKKTSVFFSAEGLLAKIPERARAVELDKTRKAILSLNDNRVMFAHSPFSSVAGGGISFRQVAVGQKLVVSSISMSEEEIDEICTKAKNTSVQIKKLSDEMKPYVPALDFSDPRNSMYLQVLFLVAITFELIQKTGIPEIVS